MTPEVIYHNLEIGFSYNNHEIIDIDWIFQLADKKYVELCEQTNCPLDLSLKFKNSKKLYTHSFFHCLFEFIKSRKGKVFWYSSIKTKDTLGNRIVTKLKRILGVQVLERHESLLELILGLSRGDCEVITQMELFLSQEKKPKRFKTILKHLEKEGLIYLYQQYFPDYQNKVLLFS